MKTCNMCQVTRPLSEFNTDRSRKDGLQYRCRKCEHSRCHAYEKRKPASVRKSKAVKNKEFHQLKKAQIAERKLKSWGYPEPTRARPPHCECCGKPPKTGKVLHLDHCHSTGKFRGWLCMACNTSIGRLGDTLPAVAAALEYLARSL